MSPDQPQPLLKVIHRSGGVALVTLDDPGRPVNTLTPQLLAQLQQSLEPLLADPAVKALVLISGKPNCFIAGADLKLFTQVSDPQEITRVDREYSELFSALERSPKPVVAAVQGSALGGGLEAALACDYIIASQHASTKLGLPEVRLGILPGAGGTQRLPARVGLPKGLDLLLTGRRVGPVTARRLGLVDEVCPPENLLPRALEMAQEMAQGRFKPRRVLSWKNRWARLPLIRGLVLARARARVLARTRGNLPGPLAILDCVATGLRKGRAAGLEREIHHIGGLFDTPQRRALVWLFLAAQELEFPAPALDGEAEPLRNLAVVGVSGVGAGLAERSAGVLRVSVVDDDPKALEDCAARIWSRLSQRYASGAISQAERDQGWAGFAPLTKMGRLGAVQVVVEAAAGDLLDKQGILARIESDYGEQTVIICHTSFLTRREVVAQASRPGQVLVGHWCQPSESCPLWELAQGEDISPLAWERARELARLQGKTLLLVRDSPGFFAMRCGLPVLHEAVRMVWEGTPVGRVDQVLMDFGWGQGPLAMLDRMGLPGVQRTGNQLAWVLPQEGLTPPRLLSDLVQQGCWGQRNLRGFYQYSEKAGTHPKPNQLKDLLENAGGVEVPPQDIRDRVALLLINQAARCVEREVVASPAQADLAAVLALSFPPFRGGPLHYCDELGAARVVERLEELAARHGARFTPVDSLRDLARRGAKFFK